MKMTNENKIKQITYIAIVAGIIQSTVACVIVN